MEIKRKCLVGCTIGKKYEDEIWCDKSIDACHLLLGRPLQYGQKVLHKGFKNTRSFVKDGVHITLAPLNPKKKDSKVTGNAFLTSSQVEHVLNKPNEIYALLIMDATPIQSIPYHELLVP